MNTSQAGQGQLKVELISPAHLKSPSRCQLQEISAHLSRVSFTPTEPGLYQLRLLFNNQLVQGKPIDVLVQPAAKSPVSQLVRIQQIQPNRPAEIGDEICLQSNLKISFSLLVIVIDRLFQSHLNIRRSVRFKDKFFTTAVPSPVNLNGTAKRPVGFSNSSLIFREFIKFI